MIHINRLFWEGLNFSLNCSTSYTSLGFLNIAVRTKKRKKKKSKKDKRKSQKSLKDEQEDADASRRSAVFKSFIPPSMMISHGGARKSFTSAITKDDLAAIGYGDVTREIDLDPNDDLPTFTSGKSNLWNPAALVNAAKSRLSDGRIDKHGFYNNIKGHADSAYGKVQTLVKGKQDRFENDFNLHTIGKSRKKTYSPHLQRCDSIVWADDRITGHGADDAGADHKGGGVGANREADWIELVDTRADRHSEGITMVDDCSFELNEANATFLMNEKRIKKLMWQRDRRRLGLCLIASVAIFCIWLGLYLGFSNISSSRPQSPTLSSDDGIHRSAPPPRPLPPAPIEPIDGFDDGSSSHSITATELRYIVNQITPDPSILSNPHTPQAKAFEWCKNDIKIYSVDITSRVVQRYALATLYYSTNGTQWATRKVIYSFILFCQQSHIRNSPLTLTANISL
jgi:hypothetical protein